MKRKEAIIRYLGLVGRASRHQIAETLKTSLGIVSTRLKELKHAGVVRNITWPDGSRVWILTKEGGVRYDYYARRDKRDRERANNRISQRN